MFLVLFLLVGLFCPVSNYHLEFFVYKMQSQLESRFLPDENRGETSFTPFFPPIVLFPNLKLTRILSKEALPQHH